MPARQQRRRRQRSGPEPDRISCVWRRLAAAGLPRSRAQHCGPCDCGPALWSYVVRPVHALKECVCVYGATVQVRAAWPVCIESARPIARQLQHTHVSRQPATVSPASDSCWCGTGNACAQSAAARPNQRPSNTHELPSCRRRPGAKGRLTEAVSKQPPPFSAHRSGGKPWSASIRPHSRLQSITPTNPRYLSIFAPGPRNGLHCLSCSPRHA